MLLRHAHFSGRQDKWQKLPPAHAAFISVKMTPQLFACNLSALLAPLCSYSPFPSPSPSPPEELNWTGSTVPLRVINRALFQHAGCCTEVFSQTSPSSRGCWVSSRRIRASTASEHRTVSVCSGKVTLVKLHSIYNGSLPRKRNPRTKNLLLIWFFQRSS